MCDSMLKELDDLDSILAKASLKKLNTSMLMS